MLPMKTNICNCDIAFMEIHVHHIKFAIIKMIGIYQFNNHWVDAIAGGQKVTKNIHQPSNQTCLTPHYTMILIIYQNWQYYKFPNT